MDGLTDAGPSCNLSYVDRLALLHDHRAAWGMLHWKDKKTIPFHGSCQAYELVGGVFAKTMSSMHFDATVLPTSLDPDYHMISMDLKLPVRDFVIDPTQDLLVLVEAGSVGRSVYFPCARRSFMGLTRSQALIGHADSLA